MIDERRIRYLLTIADAGSITAAAERLYVTQPALSRMLINLERELGCELFHRGRRRLRPTPAGEIYLRGCREVLAEASSVRDEIADLRDESRGRIVFGMTSFTAEFLLPRIWTDFHERFPGVELALAEERMSDLAGLVRQSEVDLALAYRVDGDELEGEPVLSDTVYLQVPSSKAAELGMSPGRGNAPVDARILEGAPLVLLKPGRNMRALADDALHALGIAPGPVTETANMHIACELAELAGAFTFVPGMAAQQPQRGRGPALCEIEGYPMRRELLCLHRRGRYLTRAERHLIELVKGLRP